MQKHGKDASRRDDVSTPWRVNLRYQVWAKLPDRRAILIGESVHRAWALKFAEMVPTEIACGTVTVQLVELSGPIRAENNRLPLEWVADNDR